MKIENSNEKINPFGGINFLIQDIRKSGVLELIDNELGKRAPQAKYKHSELFLNLWSVFLCGGDCAEDINEHLKDYLQNIPKMKVANADTILLDLKNLKTEKEKVTSSQGNVYEINRNDKINQLNISILKHLGELKEGELYDFDYDNEILKTEKYDTKRTYKQVNGYFPSMATINGKPVYFENRDGNMNVKTIQEDVLERAYKMLNDNKIYINRSRMDCGSYTQKVVEVIEKYSKLFYIRAMKSQEMVHEIRNITKWEKVEINFIQYEVASIEYRPFNKKKAYRLVIMRCDKGNKQMDLFTNDTLEYRSILTNDWVSTEKQVIEYYNQRGCEEKVIDVLNNDFGWSKMPFSFMEENTVFLLVMIICKNIYSYLISKISKTCTWVNKNFRMKKFIFRFITVPTKWIKRGGQQIMKIYSQKQYNMSYI